MQNYKESNEIATKYLKNLDKDLKRHGARSTGDKIEFEIEYYDLQYLCESYLALKEQYNRVTKLINLCVEIRRDDKWNNS